MYTAKQQQDLHQQSRQWLERTIDSVTADTIHELRKLLRYHEWRYYVQNDPLLADYEYDQLFKLLEEAEQLHPEWITTDSPTQRVGSDQTHDFPRVNHLQPMLSLANSYNAEDLYDFEKQIRKLLDLSDEEVISYTVEPKYDGGGLSLLYKNDLLERGATRGNGQAGDDITPNARALHSVPLQAAFSDYNIATVEVRGEALIPLDLFAKINEAREAAGDQPFANPRNAATGGLRTKDAAESAARGIRMFAYSLGYVADAEGNSRRGNIQTHAQVITLLRQLGFQTPDVEGLVFKGIDEVITRVQAVEGERANLPYEIDGMVVKVNRLDWQEACGATSHHPRWAIAYKFKAKQATTQLVDVEYQVGKVGSITPVAKVQPVGLAGVTVSSISLHNADFIRDKDIRIGDYLLIERAGDVIPYIVKSLADMRTGQERVIQYPTFCPINKNEEVPLVRIEGEAAWRCPSCSCGAQPLQRLIWHVSKHAMDIDGMGQSTLLRFWEMGWVRNIEDIYALDYDKIAELEGFGQRSAEKLRAAIEKAKSNPIHRLLHSLSIHHLGRRGSKLLAETVQHVLDLQHKTREELEDIKDIGPILAKNVVAYFQDAENIHQLQRMEQLGVNLSQTEEDRPAKAADESAALYGNTILFTGSLQQMTRQQAQEKARTAGARVLSAVSSKLDILVVGEKAGSKLKKAEALGTVQVLSEAEFLQLLGE